MSIQMCDCKKYENKCSKNAKKDGKCYFCSLDKCSTYQHSTEKLCVCNKYNTKCSYYSTGPLNKCKFCYNGICNTRFQHKINIYDKILCNCEKFGNKCVNNASKDGKCIFCCDGICNTKFQHINNIIQKPITDYPCVCTKINSPCKLFAYKNGGECYYCNKGICSEIHHEEINNSDLNNLMI